MTIKRGLREALTRHREMLQALTANDANSRRMIYGWADEHAHRSNYPL